MCQGAAAGGRDEGGEGVCAWYRKPGRFAALTSTNIWARGVGACSRKHAFVLLKKPIRRRDRQGGKGSAPQLTAVPIPYVSLSYACTSIKKIGPLHGVSAE